MVPMLIGQSRPHHLRGGHAYSICAWLHRGWDMGPNLWPEVIRPHYCTEYYDNLEYIPPLPHVNGE